MSEPPKNHTTARCTRGSVELEPIGAPITSVACYGDDSAMFMNFDDGKHWVPVYRARFQGDIRPLQMRIYTKFKPENSDVPSDVRSYSLSPSGLWLSS